MDLRDVLRARVEDVFDRTKALRKAAEEIEREAGQVLAIVDQSD